MLKLTQLLLLLIVSSPLLAEPVKIVASTANPEDSLHVFALKAFKKNLAALSNDNIGAEIYFKGSETHPSIGGEEDNVNMIMARGSYGHYSPIQMSVVAAGNASVRIHLLEFLMLPYMFPDLESAKKLFRNQAMMDKINTIIALRHNVRVLGWLIGGYRHMTNSKVPVANLDQMKGLIIRTPRNRLMLDTYAALGAKAVPVSWSATFGALKSGKVDGQENPLNVIAYSKFWDANQQFVTLNGPFLWVGPMLIKESFYQSLTPKQQRYVNQAAREAAEEEWQWVEKQNAEFQSVLESNGMKLIALEDKPRWIEKTRPLWDSYAKIIGYGKEEKGKAFIDEVQAILASP